MKGGNLTEHDMMQQVSASLSWSQLCRPMPEFLDLFKTPEEAWFFTVLDRPNMTRTLERVSGIRLCRCQLVRFCGQRLTGGSVVVVTQQRSVEFKFRTALLHRSPHDCLTCVAAIFCLMNLCSSISAAHQKDADMPKSE